MELKNKIDLNSTPIYKNKMPKFVVKKAKSSKIDLVENPINPSQLKNKIDKDIKVISHNISNENMNDIIKTAYKACRESVKFDPKSKGFTTINNSQYKANHFVSDIAIKCNAVGIAYHTKYNTTSMGFKVVSTEKLDKILSSKTDMGYYEVLDDVSARKLYFDVDFEGGTIDKYEEIKEEIFKIFKGEGLCFDNSSIREVGSIREKNNQAYVSYHIIVNNGYLFENSTHISNVMKWMICKYPRLGEIIDGSVYNKYRNFRLPYQSKNGNTNAIQVDKVPNGLCADYLINVRGDTTNYQLYPTKDISTLTKCISKKTGKEIRLTDSNKDNILNHTNYATAFPVGYRVEVGKNDGSLEYIMKSIPNNHRVGYDVWLKIGMALFRVCKDKEYDMKKGLDLWVEWTKIYDTNCSYEKMKSLYNVFNGKGYGMATLCAMAKIYNKDFDKKVKSSFTLYEVPPNTFTNSMMVEGRYLSDVVDLTKIINENTATILKAPMGTGKTYGIRPILSNPDKTILYVSCKRAFGNALAVDIAPYGFKNYMEFKNDKQGIRGCDKIICSIESMKYCRDSYDYIFFDECETLLTNMTGEMCMKNNPMENLIKISKIIKDKNTKLILMDAYVGKRTIDFVKEMYKDNEVLYVENTFQYPKRTYKECKDIKIGKSTIGKKDIFKSEIMKSLQNGEKISICSGSKTLLKEIELEILKTYGNSKKYIFYCKENPLLSNIDVDTEWDDIDILMYSPTITAGISYDLNGKNKPFDKLFIYIGFSNNPLARDMIQAHKRVRHFNNPEIIVCISYIANLVKWDKLPTDIKIIKETEKHFKEDFYKEGGVYSISEIDSIKWVENIHYNNILERNVNDTQLPTTMLCFMKYENIVKTGNCDMDGMIGCSQSVQQFKYDEIKDISMVDYDNIISNISNEEYETLTDEDWDAMKKYRYNNIRIREDLTTEKAEEYFNENLVEDPTDFGNVSKSNNIHRFLSYIDSDSIEELKLDYCDLVEDINKLEDVRNVNQVVEFNNIKIKKTALIYDMFKRLKLYDEETNTINIDKEFNTMDIENMMEDYEKIRYSSINKMLLFELLTNKNKDKSKFTILNMKAVINNVMKDEFNLDVSPPISKKKITISKGVRKNVATFKLKQYKIIPAVNPSDEEIKREVMNGFMVYRNVNIGMDKNINELDFLDEDEPAGMPIIPNAEFIESMKKHKEQEEEHKKVMKQNRLRDEFPQLKKDIVKKYYKEIMMNKVKMGVQECKEVNRVLSMKMNKEIDEARKNI